MRINEFYMHNTFSLQTERLMKKELCLYWVIILYWNIKCQTFNEKMYYYIKICMSIFVSETKCKEKRFKKDTLES